MLEYQSLNKQVFESVQQDAISILDIGCGTGEMGKALLRNKPSRKIHGITFSSIEAMEARKNYKKVYIHDLNDISLQMDEEFDVLICSHVLEHTMFPLTVLKHYLQYLRPGGQVIIALPNVLFFRQRLQFLLGYFRYNPNGGLMDSTHFKFFDFKTSQQLLKDARLELVSANGFGAFPLPGIRKLFPGLASKIDSLSCQLFPGLFSFQFVLVGKKQL